jgi:DNA primase
MNSLPQSSYSAAEIAHHLSGRKSGAGYMARCPVHEDRTPSLSLRDSDGKVLVHCFGGCTQAAVIAALRERGLWPERITQSAPLPDVDRRRYAQARSAALQLARDAELWWSERRQELEDQKAAASERGDVAAFIAAARSHYLLGELAGEGIIRAYQQACDREPLQTAALIDAAESWARWAEAAITALVARWHDDAVALDRRETDGGAI